MLKGMFNRGENKGEQGRDGERESKHEEIKECTAEDV